MFPAAAPQQGFLDSMLMTVAAAGASLLGQQLACRQASDGLLRGAVFLHEVNANARGAHGLHGARTDASHDHRLAITKEAREAAVVMVMTGFMLITNHS